MTCKLHRNDYSARRHRANTYYFTTITDYHRTIDSTGPLEQLALVTSVSQAAYNFQTLGNPPGRSTMAIHIIPWTYTEGVAPPPTFAQALGDQHAFGDNTLLSLLLDSNGIEAQDTWAREAREIGASLTSRVKVCVCGGNMSARRYEDLYNACLRYYESKISA